MFENIGVKSDNTVKGYLHILRNPIKTWYYKEKSTV